MNKFKVSPTSAFNKLYDTNHLFRYASDDNLININESKEVGHYLFCYGSNSLNQLKKRLKKNNLIAKKAYLPNHIRIFAGHSNKWNGGTSSIMKTEDNYYVKGLIVYLYENDFKKLDKYEGATKNQNPFSKEDNIYRRKYIVVKDSNDENINCIIYQKNNHNWISYPSDEYLEAIKENMKYYWPELDNTNQLFVYDKNLNLKGVF